MRKFLTLPGLKLRLLGRPARSQPLYRLSYPGSDLIVLLQFFFFKNKGSRLKALRACFHVRSKLVVVVVSSSVRTFLTTLKKFRLQFSNYPDNS
jgi:hypothetical protein